MLLLLPTESSDTPLPWHCVARPSRRGVAEAAVAVSGF